MVKLVRDVVKQGWKMTWGYCIAVRFVSAQGCKIISSGRAGDYKLGWISSKHLVYNVEYLASQIEIMMCCHGNHKHKGQKKFCGQRQCLVKKFLRTD